jgi:shikimate dehydrogenase
MSNNTKQFTIFGDPVIHSKSPQMHNAGFRFINYDANYSKHQLKDGSTIKDVFLENNYCGANITVPHKEFAYKNADILDDFARDIKAVNTYINENGKIKGFNTDAPGFYKAIGEFENINKVLLIGAGGTAKAIAVILRKYNIEVTILNRSQNSRDFFTNLGCKFFDWDSMRLMLSNGIISYDLVVNSTSAGLKDQLYPAPLEILEPLIESSNYIFDCIYGKITPFLQIAKKYKKPFKDGEDMLLYQGVLAFELFTGVKADKHLIEDMRKGLKES